MNNINYQKELEKLLNQLKNNKEVPTLFIHSCCAPCSSYVLEYLSEYFKITVFYYNPNIYPAEEYHKRVKEQEDLIGKMSPKYPVEFLAGTYEPSKFYHAIKGMEHMKEGSQRCYSCYELRLRESAVIAKELEFDYFTTTLSISPMKNAAKLNEIGSQLEEEYGVKYLHSDFKKRNGYKRSIELSNDYGLYRQDYCGCVFSKKERQESLKES
ncbi:MAG TPA: epoxyqueuosine reductase QueH [Candidatus Merdenecus merdavium]|nr:epoxyqueuosine reductase QueH [Candidatus Merdenecus merdavium]